MENYYHAYDNGRTEFLMITHALLEGKCKDGSVIEVSTVDHTLDIRVQ